MTQTLSIVIPAYNEAARIAGSLAEVIRFARAFPGTREIIVVDDGSTDSTSALVAAARAELNGDALVLKLITHPRNLGKGAAVRTGMAAASSDIVLFSDTDLSTPMSEAPRLIEPILADEADVVIGSRAVDPSRIQAQQGLIRRSAGRMFNRMVRVVAGLDLLDTQCGFKAFRRASVAPLLSHLRVDGFAFDVELLYLANKHGLRIREMPVTWAHASGSKVSLLTHTREMACDLLRIRLNDLRGAYRA